jgi:hypothetical protein
MQYLYANGAFNTPGQVMASSFIANVAKNFVRVQFTAWIGGTKDIAVGLANKTLNPSWPGDDWGYPNTLGHYADFTNSGELDFDWIFSFPVSVDDEIAVFFTCTSPGSTPSRPRVRNISVSLVDGPQSFTP